MKKAKDKHTYKQTQTHTQTYKYSIVLLVDVLRIKNVLPFIII